MKLRGWKFSRSGSAAFVVAAVLFQPASLDRAVAASSAEEVLRQTTSAGHVHNLEVRSGHVFLASPLRAVSHNQSSTGDIDPEDAAAQFLADLRHFAVVADEAKKAQEEATQELQDAFDERYRMLRRDLKRGKLTEEAYEEEYAKQWAEFQVEMRKIENIQRKALNRNANHGFLKSIEGALGPGKP